MKPRVGLYTGGLKAYWNQFSGLKKRLIGYGKFIEDQLSEKAEIFNYGLVDDAFSGRDAGEYFNKNYVDIILCHMGTYYTSSSILPIHQICKATVIILNLQPTAEMNYSKTTTGEWLAHCVACAVPELCNAFNRSGIEYHLVSGLLGLSVTPEISVADEITSVRPEATKAWDEIYQWIDVAGVKRTLSHARFGVLGNNYSGMLDMYSDYTALQAKFGLHVEILEMCDLDRIIQTVTPDELKEKIIEIRNFFEISKNSPSEPLAKKPSNEQLDWSAKIAVAQEKMVNEYNLNAVSYYYHGSNNYYEEIQSGFIVGFSLLTAKGIPCAGECDIKTAIAMKICDTLAKGGSFCEIVATDYNKGTIILGHDGPFHINISDGKPILRGMEVYHGKKGSGISVEAQIKTGDVTLLGITQTADGVLKMIISKGESIKAKTLMIGNTQTHVKFELDPDTYMNKWFMQAPTHHFAMSVGDNTKLFEKVAKILKIQYVII
jgi:L-arabinose isomerase